MNKNNLHLLEAVFKSSSEIYLLLSTDLNILAINPAAERLYQWKASEVLDKNFKDLCAAYEYNFLLDPNALATLKKEKIMHLFSFGIGSHTTKEKIRWKLVSFSDENHQSFILCVGSFIQEPAITAVDVNNIWLSMPGNLFWKDKEGVYLGATNRMATAIGLKAGEDVIGKTDYDLFPEQQAHLLRSNDQEIIDSGCSKIIEETVTINGTDRIFSSEKIPLKNNKKVIGIVGNSVDITHLKTLELELRKARELAETEQKIAISYLESIVECMPGSLYWKNKEGVYLGCNNFLVRMLNLESRDDIVGKTDYDLWPDQAEALRLNDEEVMQTGQSVDLEETLILNGERRYYTVVKIPLKDPQGNIVGIIGNSLDITVLKRITEELRQAKENAEIANKAKSEFLAVVSHELRIPLTNILGMTHYLGAEPISPQQREYLNNTISAANHLLTLVNDLLDFAKIEAGKFELESAPLDLKALLEETIFMFSQQAKDKKIDLLFNYPQNIPHQFLGDSRALRQIMINLVGNAIKFTKIGHISIEINCLQQLQKTASLELIVTDTGIGIPNEKLDLIFERFRQVDSSLIRKYHGTGLGLAITKALLQIMGGSIEVNSILGQGSSFKCTITFPLQDNIAVAENVELLNTTRVLLVEDVPMVLILHQKFLTDLGCIVETAEDGEQALDKLKKTYDIVFLDMGLPDISGDEVAKRYRENEAPNVHLPIIALTAYGGEEHQKKFLSSGIDKVMVKPVTKEQLSDVLKTYCKATYHFKSHEKI